MRNYPLSQHEDNAVAFDYSTLTDGERLATLDNEKKLNDLYERYQPEVGEILYNQQKILANHNDGVFQQWYESKGFKRWKVYDYINKYQYVLRNSEDPKKIDIFESMPKTLQSEMSKPSASKELNQKVYDGDITTHKEYKELERQLKEKDSQLEQAQSEKEEAERTKQFAIEQLEREQNKEPEVITQTVERVVVPDDYKDLERKSKKLEDKVFQLNRQLERIREIDSYEEKAKSIKQEVEYLNGERQKLKHIFDSAEKLQQLERKFNDFFDSEMAPLKYKPLINDLTNTNGVSRMKEMVNLARAWVEDMDRLLPAENRQIIEAEMVE